MIDSHHGLYGTLSGIFTALLILLFAAIAAWAWSSRRRKDFDAAARLPLEEDRPAGSRAAREQPP